MYRYFTMNPKQLVLDKPTRFQFPGNNRHLSENEHEFEQRNEQSITINAIVFQVGLGFATRFTARF